MSFLQSWDTHPRLEELEFILEERVPCKFHSPGCISLPERLMTTLKEKIPTLRVMKFKYHLITGPSEQYVDMTGTVSN